MEPATEESATPPPSGDVENGVEQSEMEPLLGHRGDAAQNPGSNIVNNFVLGEDDTIPSHIIPCTSYHRTSSRHFPHGHGSNS